MPEVKYRGYGFCEGTGLVTPHDRGTGRDPERRCGVSRKTYFDEQKIRKERKRPRCPVCKKRIRGENHTKGSHHRSAE